MKRKEKVLSFSFENSVFIYTGEEMGRRKEVLDEISRLKWKSFEAVTCVKEEIPTGKMIGIRNQLIL